jgi:outer membrane protein, multidrug efflux system
MREKIQEMSPYRRISGARGNRNGLQPIRRLALAICPLALAACSTVSGPDYQRPEVPTKADWSQLENRQLTASEVISPDWWTAFGDPYLNGLIQKAINQSLDLKLAALRLDRAGIELNKSRVGATPRLAAAPTDTIARQRENGARTETVRETEALGLGLSWELDVWGKIRKDLQAANAGYRASEMDWRATYLTLVGSVAQRYFEIHQLDEQIDQQTASKAQAENLLQVYQAQFAEGMIPETNLLTQKAEINSLTNRLVEMERSRTETEIKLSTLLGISQGELKVPAAGLRETVRLIDVPDVLPADMLARRPDVLKAEFDLLRAHHLVGKARLARLPTFSLSAVAKTGASLTSTFLNSWTFGLTQSWANLFDRDLKIDVKLSEADVAIAVEQYRKTVLQAFEEVEVALLNVEARKRQMGELEAQIASLQVVRTVQEARLREGLISQLELFDTERSLLSAQQEVLTTYQLLLTDTLTLYKALGGGWQAESMADRPARIAEKPIAAR